MDQAFLQLLKSEGIAEDTIEVLFSEAIISKQILSLLHEEHKKLPGKIRIGEHAILTSIWQKLETDDLGSEAASKDSEL